MPSDRHAGGALVLVVGPSGAGKDSLIDAVRPGFPEPEKLVFARRCITRPADAGGEDHEPLSVQAFQERQRSGGFLFHWQAYGLFYGIPAAYGKDLAAGAIVVANVSRSVLNEARRRFASLVFIHVTASPETLKARLAGRGRETGKAVDMRLRRAIATVPTGDDVVTVLNDGTLEEATEKFDKILRDLVARPQSFLDSTVSWVHWYVTSVVRVS